VFPPHGFYIFFMIFFKIIFVDFIFLILSWLNYNCNFPHKTLWIAIVFLYMGLFSFFFLFFMIFVFYMIFSKLSLLLYIFFFKTLWIATVIPHIFFMNFFKIVFFNFIFLILSWLRITTVYFLMKYYRLLQCFPAWFFSFCFFFLKLFF